MLPDHPAWWQSLRGTVGFLGVGNEALGDDALGIVLAQQLQARGLPQVHVTGTNPERWIHETNLKSLDHLVFLDAVDWGGAPGAVLWLAQEEMQQRFPQVTTHKLSLGLLARCVEAQGRTKAWLLGVQPETLAPAPALSSCVRKTLDLLTECLVAAFAPGSRLSHPVFPVNF
jgi:hydrogenase maturation protease